MTAIHVCHLTAMQDIQSNVQLLTELSGFVTIVAGTLLLHATKDMDISFGDLSRLTTPR